jgi:hypothetical protein
LQSVRLPRSRDWRFDLSSKKSYLRLTFGIREITGILCDRAWNCVLHTSPDDFCVWISQASRCDSDSDVLGWPPLLKAISPYWYGAITDMRMLAAHISYVVPLTAVLLYCVRQAGLHFGYAALIPGFGPYSLICTLACVGFICWGYARNRARRKTLTRVKHVRLRPD